MTYRSREPYYNHGGGLNNEKSLFNLAVDESPDLQNVIVDNGAIATRPGYVAFRAQPVTAAGEPVTSLFEFINANQEVFFLVAAGTKLKKAIVGGWQELIGGFTSGTRFQFVVNSLIMKALFVNGKDGYFQCDGNTCAAVTPYAPTVQEILEYGYNALGGYTELAQIETDLAGENNDLLYTAQLPGPSGVSIEYKDPGAAGQALSIGVVGEAITVNLATGSDSKITTTAAQIRYSINSHAQAKTLVLVTHKEGSNGSGVVTAMAAITLVGGTTYEKALTDPVFIAYHKNRTWLAVRDRVYFTGEDIEGNILYDYIPLTNWLRATNPRGEHITAIYPFKGDLYVFTKSAIRVIVGEDISDFAMAELDGTIGAVSQRSIKVVEEHMFFQGQDGIYMMKGRSAPKKVSQRIPQNIRRIDTAKRNNAAAVSWRNKYRISVPESTINDAVLEYNTDVVVINYIGEEKSYASNPWVYHKGINANDWLVSHNENLCFAAEDGYVYQYGVGFTDNGAVIDSYYVTGYMDSGVSDQIKRYRSLTIEYELTAGFMLLEYRTHENDEWKEIAEIDLSKRKPVIKFGRGIRARRIQFRFRTEGTGSYFKIYGFTPDLAVRGHQFARQQAEGKE